MTGQIFVVVGNNKNFCLIRDETGQEVYASRDSFKDQAIMLTGANVKFQLNPQPKGKRPEAMDVQAA